VLLGRLRIRSRLALLILVPIIAALIQTTVAAVAIGQQATKAAQTANHVRDASEVAVLLRALEREQLTSVGLLLGHVSRTDLALVQATTDDAAASIVHLGLLPPDTTLPTLKDLAPLRDKVLTHAIRPVDVITTYSEILVQVVDSARLLDSADGTTAQGRGVITLDAVLRANEGFAAVLAAMVAGGTPDIASGYISSLDLLQLNALRFVMYATPGETTLYVVAQIAVNTRLGPNFNQAMIGAPGATIGILNTPPSYPDVVALTGVGQYIESKVINDTVATANDALGRDEAYAGGFVGLSVVLVLLAIALGLAVARSVAVPVRRMTRSAENVARLAESELVRVADDDAAEADPVRLPPIEVTGRDELADFARAFGRVQETAARLVERQVASRRNVALMFGHVGRRTQNLVGRQISLIDRLESQETEPDRLGELYRLDHISSRLLRSASSLVVLSGAGDAGMYVAPMSLSEVVRIGLAQIEDFTRIELQVPGQVQVAPALIHDLSLLIAELLENATGFSPPGAPVQVSARPGTEELRLSIVDHGLGMNAERLAEENTRLARRERLDLAPTEVLGLFVVGRLARRHGLRVSLTETPGGGITAHVDIPAALLLSGTPTKTVASATVGHSTRELALLGRASTILRDGRPWNAFAAGSRRALSTGPAVAAPAAARVPQSPPARAPQPPAARPSQPPVARPSHPPVARAPQPPMAPVQAPPGMSTLDRRVPGASLRALEGNMGARPTALAAPSSADEVRDSLAQFESGVARAMREAQQGDQR
jgi:signal transduction histidine kinase